MTDKELYEDLLRRYHELQRSHDTEIAKLRSDNLKETRIMQRHHDKAKQHIKDEARRWKTKAEESQSKLEYKLTDPENTLTAEFDGFTYEYSMITMSPTYRMYIRSQYRLTHGDLVRQITVAVKEGYAAVCYDTHVHPEDYYAPCTKAEYVSAVRSAVQYMVDPTYEPS